MFNRNFSKWCKEAVKQIKYKPDMDMVYGELYEHMEDRYESFIAGGCSGDEAEKKTLESMGDAKEIAPEFAAIYKPFWGFAMTVTGWVSLILVLIAVVLLLYRVSEIFIETRRIDSYYDMHDNDRGSLVLHSEPMVTDHSDGYKFTLTQASVYRSSYDAYKLYLTIEVSTQLPLLAYPKLYRWTLSTGSGQTVYLSKEGDQWFSEYSVSLTEATLSGMLTYTYDICISKVDPEIEWAEFSYNLSGRDIVLRADLAGGDR